MFTIVSKDNSNERTLSRVYDTGEAAAKRATLLNARAKKLGRTRRYRVVKAEIGLQDRELWREREQRRFTCGVYKVTPWHFHNWASYTDATAHHYAHVSTDDPTLLAYTENDIKGMQDKQLRIKPGRYLKRFYSKVLSPDTIQRWVDRWTRENTAAEVQFARAADEIEDVYLNGPSSCMSHRAQRYLSPCHPTRMYAGPDLAVAYISDPIDDRITARAVVWPEKKLHTTIYGDDSRLEPALTKLGYSNECLAGARFTRQEYDGNFIVPYIDCCHTATRHGDHLMIACGDGEIDCSSEWGLSSPKETCAFCEDGIRGDGATVEGEVWCERCVDNHSFSCSHCDERRRDDNRAFASNSYDICNSCSVYYVQCDHCDEYFHERNTQEDCHGNVVCNRCQRSMTSAPCGAIEPNPGECSCQACDNQRGAQEKADQEREAAAADPRQLALTLIREETP